VDESPVDYLFWDGIVITHFPKFGIHILTLWIVDGSPDTHEGVDLCVGIRSYGGFFNYHCGHLSTFFCEIEAGIEAPTTASTPTPPPIKNCQEEEDGWITRPGNRPL